jgi:hypothetical protein
VLLPVAFCFPEATRYNLFSDVLSKADFMSESFMSDRKLGGDFEAIVDHIALESQDLTRDVGDYERVGFHLETLYDDWAMLRDSKGFGVALLGPGSKHPPHMGLRVETREQLEAAAEREGRPIKKHRDHSLSFYTRGVAGRAVEVIYYPPEYGGHSQGAAEN